MAQVNLGRVKGEQGVSITEITQTASDEDGGTNEVNITLSDGSTTTLYIKNGSKGEKGDNGSNIINSDTEPTTQSDNEYWVKEY